MNHSLLSIPSLCLCNKGKSILLPPSQALGHQDEPRFPILLFGCELSCFLVNCCLNYYKKEIWTYSNLLNIIFSFILGWITTCQKIQQNKHTSSVKSQSQSVTAWGPMQGESSTRNYITMGSIPACQTMQRMTVPHCSYDRRYCSHKLCSVTFQWQWWHTAYCCPLTLPTTSHPPIPHAEPTKPFRQLHWK